MILKFWPTYARTNRLTIGGVEEIFTIENNILETMIMSLQKLVCLRAKTYSCLCPQLGVHDLNGAQVFFFFLFWFMWPQLKARSSHYLTTHPTMVFVTCDSSGVLQLFSFWFMWPQLRARRFSSGKTNAPFSTCLIA